MRRLIRFVRRRSKKLVSIGDNNQSFSRPAWETADLVGADYYVDVRKEPLPFEANSLDAVHCSHLIEHINEQQGTAFLREIYRCLKPGGIVRISTPDMDVLLDRYRENDWRFFLAADGEYILRQVNLGKLPPESLLINNRLIGWFASYSGRLDTGGGPIVSKQQLDDALKRRSKYEFRDWSVSLLESNRILAHVHVYDYAELRSALQAVGFREVVRCGFGESVSDEMSNPPIDVPRHEIYSLYVEAIK